MGNEEAVTGRNLFSVPPFWLSCGGFESGGGKERLHARGGEDSRPPCPQSALID